MLFFRIFNQMKENISKPDISCKFSEAILDNYHIRTTPIRCSVLRTFLEKPFALSHSDILSELENQFDRVTVYRTMNLFLEKGLIHLAFSDTEGKLYALCDLNRCDTSRHHHDHLHLRCSECHHVYCIDSVAIPAINIPEGYQFTELQLLAEGICNLCSTLKKDTQ